MLTKSYYRKSICTLCLMFLFANTAYSQQIITDGFTSTTLNTQGATTNVSTTTIKGANAFNSFKKFNVDAGKTVNLIVPGDATNLINIVKTQASQINGTLHSLKNGITGGNIYLVNPYGIIVGPQGFINVGSLTLSTPSTAFANGFFTSQGNPDPNSVNALINGTEPLNTTGITINGKINAFNNVTLNSSLPNISKTGFIEMKNFVNVGALANGNVLIKSPTQITIAGTINTDGTNNCAPGNLTFNQFEPTSGKIDILSTAIISAKSLDTTIPGGDITFTGFNINQQKGSTLTGGGILNITAGDSVDFSGYSSIAKNMGINAINHVNFNGDVNGLMIINASIGGGFVNIYSNNSVRLHTINSSIVSISANGILDGKAGEVSNIVADSVIFNSSDVIGQLHDDINITSQNQTSTSITAKASGNICLTSNNAVTNIDQLDTSGGDIFLTSSKDIINNISGLIRGKNITVNSGGDFNKFDVYHTSTNGWLNIIARFGNTSLNFPEGNLNINQIDGVSFVISGVAGEVTNARPDDIDFNINCNSLTLNTSRGIGTPDKKLNISQYIKNDKLPELNLKAYKSAFLKGNNQNNLPFYINNIASQYGNVDLTTNTSIIGNGGSASVPNIAGNNINLIAIEANSTIGLNEQNPLYINLNSWDNSGYLSAQSQGDMYISSNDDLNIKQLSNDGRANIYLESVKGNINMIPNTITADDVAGNEHLSPILTSSLTMHALNGNIGTLYSPVKFDTDHNIGGVMGTVKNIQAKGKIYLQELKGDMYAGLITNGGRDLVSIRSSAGGIFVDPQNSSVIYGKDVTLSALKNIGNFTDYGNYDQFISVQMPDAVPDNNRPRLNLNSDHGSIYVKRLIGMGYNMYIDEIKAPYGVINLYNDGPILSSANPATKMNLNASRSTASRLISNGPQTVERIIYSQFGEPDNYLLFSNNMPLMLQFSGYYNGKYLRPVQP